MKQSEGFTFIEILVVVALVGIIMTGIVGILLSVLRTSRKNEAMTNLKQAGDYALGVISGKIRNTQEIKCEGTVLTLTNLNDLTTVISLTCDTDSDSIKENDNYLISEEVGMSLSDCEISCVSGVSGSPDSVMVGFTLSSGLGDDPTSHVEAVFKTTISLRNY